MPPILSPAGPLFDGESADFYNLELSDTNGEAPASKCTNGRRQALSPAPAPPVGMRPSTERAQPSPCKLARARTCLVPCPAQSPTTTRTTISKRRGWSLRSSTEPAVQMTGASQSSVLCSVDYAVHCCNCEKSNPAGPGQLPPSTHRPCAHTQLQAPVLTVLVSAVRSPAGWRTALARQGRQGGQPRLARYGGGRLGAQVQLPQGLAQAGRNGRVAGLHLQAAQRGRRGALSASLPGQQAGGK